MDFDMNRLILHTFLSKTMMNANQLNPKTPFIHT